MAISGEFVERLLDNAATASQVRELLRCDNGEETCLREAVRLNVVEPLLRLLKDQNTDAEKANGSATPAPGPESGRSWPPKMAGVPYPKFCHHPDKCSGLSNCPRDPTCAD